MLCRGTSLLLVLTATVYGCVWVCVCVWGEGGLFDQWRFWRVLSSLCRVKVCQLAALVYLYLFFKENRKLRYTEVFAYFLQQTSSFFTSACVRLGVWECVWEYMISSGDRILRACSNWRANANAWLVALHQLVLKSEVAHSAVQALALGQKQILVALDSFSLKPLIFVIPAQVVSLYLVAL